MTSGYILDTNIFNRILDAGIESFALGNGVEVYITHVQKNELAATKTPERRSRLLEVLHTIDPAQIPTESAIWDVSEWDNAKWPKDDGLFDTILDTLDSRNDRKCNNKQDVLIAETAIRNGLILVTEDRKLAQIVSELGGKSVGFKELLQSSGPTARI